MTDWTNCVPVVNPMNRNDFITALEHNNISLDESRLHEVNYYWNLWVDSVNYGRKNKAAKPTFVAFCNWMKKQ